MNAVEPERIEQTGTRGVASSGRRRARSLLPPTEQLLAEGGDARIVLDPVHGRNRYGCRTFPDPGLIGLGSATASVISEAGFAAADRLRRRLVRVAGAGLAAAAYARELQRIRRELLALCGVTALPDVEVVLAASGTDAHLLAAQLAGPAPSTSMLVITVERSETGSAVPAALAGRRCGTCYGPARCVDGCSAVDDGRDIEFASVPLRMADGTARSAAAIDAEVERLMSEAISAGRRVLLVVVDVSKTGIIAPTPDCVAALQRRWANRIDILVDACQFRLAPASLRGYLQHGCMVALTGSKFITGPTFSAALLIPGSMAARMRERALSPAAQACSARADWPLGWRAAQGLETATNFGLVLRWEAALQELRAFRSIPDQEVGRFLEAFSRAVQDRLAGHPAFELLPPPELDRRPFAAAVSWDHIPTIFPFLLYHREPHAQRMAVSREETEQIYRLLPEDLATSLGSKLGADVGDIAGLRCQLAQPVACGHRQGQPVSALRLCASARLIVEGTADGGRQAFSVIARALAVLDKTALLAQPALRSLAMRHQI